MSPASIQRVRSSWALAVTDADALTTRFYAHLFAVDAGAASLFEGADMAAQRMKLVQTLAILVRSLDDSERLVHALAALGKRHTQYGVETRHFESVGEALLAALGDTLGPSFTPALRSAWAEVYELVASVMRRALIRAGTP